MALNFEALARALDDKLRSLASVDPRVADAMLAAKRHRYVPFAEAAYAYDDRALPIGHGQTISQPSMIAQAISWASVRKTDRVLDVGGGSGFTAAVLAQLAREVVTVERVAELAEKAKKNLRAAGVFNVSVVVGDAWRAPGADGMFDVIFVSAGAPNVPRHAVERLNPEGRLMLPVGTRAKDGGVTGKMVRLTKTDGDPLVEPMCSCSYVPLIGQDGWPEQP